MADLVNLTQWCQEGNGAPHRFDSDRYEDNDAALDFEVRALRAGAVGVFIDRTQVAQVGYVGVDGIYCYETKTYWVAQPTDLETQLRLAKFLIQCCFIEADEYTLNCVTYWRLSHDS